MDYDDYWVKREDKTHDYYKNLYGPIKEELIPHNKDLNILDVGGGSGAFLRYLGIKNATILDISKSGINSAKKKGYSIVTADCQKPFPLTDESFDTIYCMELLEHIDDSAVTIKEIYRILKNDGVAIFVVPNIWREKPDDHHIRQWRCQELKNKWVFKCPRLKDTRLRIITKNFAKAFPNIFASFFLIKVEKHGEANNHA